GLLRSAAGAGPRSSSGPAGVGRQVVEDHLRDVGPSNPVRRAASSGDDDATAAATAGSEKSRLTWTRESLPRRPLRRVARWSSSSSFVPRLDRCLKPVEIHVFQVRAAQFFAVSFVESVETNGVEDLPEWSAVTKNPDKRSFGSGAVYPERNGHETRPLGLSCSKILSRLPRSPRPCAVSCCRKSSRARATP